MSYKLNKIEDNNFGKLNLTLGEFLVKNEISIYALSQATNIDWAIIKKYATSDNIYRIDKSLLEKILTSLHCELDDIISFEKDFEIHNQKKTKISTR